MRFWKAKWQFEWCLASVGAGMCLFATMMITVISVFGRYVMHVDLIPGAYNIIERLIFPLMVFWALPVAHREGTFPRLESLPDALSPHWKAVVSAFVLLIEIAIFAILIWFVVGFAWTAMKTNRTMQIGSDYWPLWPVLAMMPLAFGLMIIEMIRLFVADARKVLDIRRARAA